MKNYVFNYIDSFGTKTLDESPWNIYDAFIFSLISYVPFEKNKLYPEYDNISTIEAIDKIDNTDFGKRRIKEMELTRRVLLASRYQKCRIVFPKYVQDDEQEKRFFGLTIILDNICFVSFRGTDSSIVGWKEDLNMSFLSPIPAQEEASLYLKDIVDKYKEKDIYVGGHSKGGSLAVYAGAKQNSECIKKIYSFDGPGFLKSFYESKEYQSLKPKIVKIVPKSSIIGMLLYQDHNYQVIESDSQNIMQHDPFNWILSNDGFKFCKDVSKPYQHLSVAINELVENLDDEEKKIFCDEIYQAFCFLQIDEFRNAKANAKMGLNSLKLIIPYLQSINPKNAKIIFNVVKTFIRLYLDSQD